VGNIKITKLVQGMLPFLVTEIIMLFLLLFFPSLSLTPLNWLMGG
jgi:TRAP-type C4-dicarboxylate transport system permease large subunit